jgi:thiol-disulfide isomerase/thioredoxin
LPDTTKYNLEEVIKITVRKHKNVTTGTKEIISTISDEYEGAEEQLELIAFYKRAYDYKVVDKKVLKNLIDSLSENGINEKVRLTASETRNFVEYRLLHKKIKDFELPDKNGNLIKLSSLTNKFVIIELWATWCGPCIEEMHKIPELRAKNQHIEFYSISLDKSADKMKKFIEKKRYDWPIVFGGYADTNQELWDYLNIVAVPKYYTIDRNGVVINIADHLDVEYINRLK